MSIDAKNVISKKNDTPITGCGFINKTCVISDGSGKIHLFDVDHSYKSHFLHSGAILEMAIDKKKQVIYTAGDDGRLVQYAQNEKETVIFENDKWVDTVTTNHRGGVFWSVEKTIYALSRSSDISYKIDAPSSVSGLACSPDGRLLGAAVYGGAFLTMLNAPQKQKLLKWSGSHRKIGFSIDGKFCVTATSENTLHVWNVDKPDEHHGQMGGYPHKPSSFDWSADGRIMATSGADRLVLWPFESATGPIGNSAEVVETDLRVVTCVAPRPFSRQFLIGFSDGGLGIFDRKNNMITDFFTPRVTSSPVSQISVRNDGKAFVCVNSDNYFFVGPLS